MTNEEKEKLFQRGFMAHKERDHENPFPGTLEGEHWQRGYVNRDRMIAKRKLKDRYKELIGIRHVADRQLRE